jgi:ubiquinol-cytochrome c reductase iron-sulfur subunit
MSGSGQDQPQQINVERRRFLTTLTSVVGGVGAACAAVPFIGSWLPSARAQAMGAPIEIDISKLEAGQQLTVEWRGQPIWIINRTPESVTKLPSLDSLLRDPNSDQTEQQPSYAKNIHRSIKDQYLVLVGLCTHLGCVPTYRPDIGGVEPNWPGGFFCPCHGSKFDLAGRVYKGVPAPTNLLVPPYKFISDTVLLIGQDEKAV